MHYTITARPRFATLTVRYESDLTYAFEYRRGTTFEVDPSHCFRRGTRTYYRLHRMKEYPKMCVCTELDGVQLVEFLRTSETYAASVQTLPEPLRTFAPDIDAAIEEMLP